MFSDKEFHMGALSYRYVQLVFQTIRTWLWLASHVWSSAVTKTVNNLFLPIRYRAHHRGINDNCGHTMVESEQHWLIDKVNSESGP